MTKLETLIELNYLEKQNRKNRLEDKLKQQEYYGEIEELFDPLTKTLNANNETWLAVAAAQESQRNPTSRPGSRVLRRPGSSLGCYRLTLA